MIFSSCEIDQDESVLKLTRIPVNAKLGDSVEFELIYNPNLESLEIEKEVIVMRNIYLSFTTSKIDSLNIINIENSEHQTVVDKTGTGKFVFKTVFNQSGVNELNLGVEDYLIVASGQSENISDLETIVHSETNDSIQIEKLKLEYFKNIKIEVQANQ